MNLALTFCTRLIVLAERGVARDLPTETALDDPEWLRAFSAPTDRRTRRLAVVGPVPVMLMTTPLRRGVGGRVWRCSSRPRRCCCRSSVRARSTGGASGSDRSRTGRSSSNLRLSRTLLGLFAGGALALAGSLFQSMLRDALATPYTLGVSTGASLGAVIAIAFDWHMVAGVAGIWAGALVGAGLILFVVMGAATRSGQLSSSSLLLAGIAINSVCAALILLVHGLTGMSQSFAISRWLIGGLDAIERPTLLVYVLVVIGTGAHRHPPGPPVESAGRRRGVGGDAWRAGAARALSTATSPARSWRRRRSR